MSKPTTCPSVADPTPDACHNYIPAMIAWVARNPPTPGRLTEVETLDVGNTHIRTGSVPSDA